MTEPNLVGGIIGGVLIGIAAVLLLLINGRIAGVSGILDGLLTSSQPAERSWRLAFILGLVFGAAAYSMFYRPLPLQLQTAAPMLVIAGFLVGVGTRLGSGCTSGHGVCGLARRSPRSLLAMITFMFFGIITVYLSRHGL
jgi:uncharacterized protein